MSPLIDPQDYETHTPLTKPRVLFAFVAILVLVLIALAVIA